MLVGVQVPPPTPGASFPLLRACGVTPAATSTPTRTHRSWPRTRPDGAQEVQGTIARRAAGRCVVRGAPATGRACCRPSPLGRLGEQHGSGPVSHAFALPADLASNHGTWADQSRFRVVPTAWVVPYVPSRATSSVAPDPGGRAHRSNGHPKCCTVALSVEPAQTSASLVGEFDLSVVGVVADTLIPHLDRPVIVDLDGLTFLDSSGIQCLLTLRREASVRGGRLTVGAVSPRSAGCSRSQDSTSTRWLADRPLNAHSAADTPSFAVSVRTDVSPLPTRRASVVADCPARCTVDLPAWSRMSSFRLLETPASVSWRSRADG